MASPAAKVSFRIVMAILMVLVVFYVGRPLYWKISATVDEIRQNKRTVKQGLSQIVLEAQKSVGWFHDESDSSSGSRESRKRQGAAATRRLLSEVPHLFGPRRNKSCNGRGSSCQSESRCWSKGYVTVCQSAPGFSQPSPSLIFYSSILEFSLVSV